MDSADVGSGSRQPIYRAAGFCRAAPRPAAPLPASFTTAARSCRAAPKYLPRGSHTVPLLPSTCPPRLPPCLSQALACLTFSLAFTKRFVKLHLKIGYLHVSVWRVTRAAGVGHVCIRAAAARGMGRLDAVFSPYTPHIGVYLELVQTWEVKYMV